MAIQSWLAVAPQLGLTFLLPELAVAEVRILRPHASGVIEELVTHPHVVRTRMSPADAAGVEELLAASRTFDVNGSMGGPLMPATREVERTDNRSRPVAAHRPAGAYRAATLKLPVADVFG